MFVDLSVTVRHVVACVCVCACFSEAIQYNHRDRCVRAGSGGRGRIEAVNTSLGSHLSTHPEGGDTKRT